MPLYLPTFLLALSLPVGVAVLIGTLASILAQMMP